MQLICVAVIIFVIERHRPEPGFGDRVFQYEIFTTFEIIADKFFVITAVPKISARNRTISLFERFRISRSNKIFFVFIPERCGKILLGFGKKRTGFRRGFFVADQYRKRFHRSRRRICHGIIEKTDIFARFFQKLNEIGKQRRTFDQPFDFALVLQNHAEQFQRKRIVLFHSIFIAGIIVV